MNTKTDNPTQPDASIRVLRLSGTPRERGEAHGQALRDEIRKLGEIRYQLIREGGWSDAGARRECEASLERLRVWPDLFEEIEGIASGAGVPPWRVLLLNNYTDMRDLPPEQDGCTVLASLAPEPFAGQTWDMGGGLTGMAVVLDLDTSPRTVVLSHPGGLGMHGVNSAGLAVLINNLRSQRSGQGMPWCAVVRRMLTEGSAEDAAAILRQFPPSAGRHFLCCTDQAMVGVEVTGRSDERCVPIGANWTVHTNHYLTSLAADAVPAPEAGTSQARFGRACQILAQQENRQADLVRERLFGEALPCGVVVTPCEPGETETVAGWTYAWGDGSFTAWMGRYQAGAATHIDLSPSSAASC